MLACLQRSQTHATQHLMGGGKIPELQLPIPRKSEMSSTPSSRYPTPAELDAYARKTADSPLSIKIFPTNIRVPQHKQISRTVNGLDTTGQRYSPYAQPYSGGYQGLLAVVRTPTVSGGSSSKGVLKTAEGKRAKLSPAHIAVAPYAPPANSTAASRLRQKAYAVGHCKLPEASTIPGPPNVITAASVVPVSGGQSLPQLAHQSEIPVQSLLRHMGRPSHAAHVQGLQALGEAQTSSPALQAATATAVGAGTGCGGGGGGGGNNTTCSDSGFALAAPPHSGLAYSGAVLPMQSADTATGGQYMDSVDYALWQHKQHKQQQQPPPPPHQQQQQHYHQGALRMYGANSGGGAVVSRSPETCLPQLTAFRSAGGSGSLERVGSSPLHCPAMHGEFSVGQFFAPPWNSVLATPDSDCYNSLELPLGSTMGLPHHPHHHHHHHHHHHPSQPHAHSQHYPADRGSLGLCCGGGGTVGPPSRSLCHASVLSSSLQSLECLISEIHPPCIKERMLGRGYEAVGGSAVGMVGTRLFDPPPTHIQLPVFR